MAPQDTSFLEKIRMNNIFPPGQSIFPTGGDGGDIDIGNIFNLAQRAKDLDMQRQLNFDLEMRNRARQEQNYRINQPGLYGIAQSSMQPEQPKQVLFKESGQITPYQEAQLELSKQRLAQTGKLGEERIETSRRGQDIQQQRANVYEWRAKNPNMRIVAPKGGNIQGVNPVTGEVIADFGPSGTLTDEERINLTGEKAMERIEAVTERGREARKETGEQRLGEIAARAAETRKTQAERPISPTQTRTRQQITAQQLINTRPDLARYIEVTPEGDVAISAQPGTIEYQQINQAIYGKPGKDIELPSTKKKTTTTPTTKTPKASDPLGIRNLP